MKNEMYIILTLIPLLAGCGDKKRSSARSDARSGNKRSQSGGERHHTD